MDRPSRIIQLLAHFSIFEHIPGNCQQTIYTSSSKTHPAPPSQFKHSDHRRRSGWSVIGLGFPNTASPELPRTENQKHSMANDGRLVIVPSASSGTRVDINLKFFMVMTTVLCWVKRLLVVLKNFKEFSQRHNGFFQQ